MFCKNCGQAAEEGHVFCKACGAPLAGDGAVQEAVLRVNMQVDKVILGHCY